MTVRHSSELCKFNCNLFFAVSVLHFVLFGILCQDTFLDPHDEEAISLKTFSFLLIWLWISLMFFGLISYVRRENAEKHSTKWSFWFWAPLCICSLKITNMQVVLVLNSLELNSVSHFHVNNFIFILWKVTVYVTIRIIFEMMYDIVLRE